MSVQITNAFTMCGMIIMALSVIVLLVIVITSRKKRGKRQRRMATIFALTGVCGMLLSIAGIAYLLLM